MILWYYNSVGEILKLANCRQFFADGSCVQSSQAEVGFCPCRHSCKQQRCLSCSSQALQMSLHTGLPILPRCPQFLTSTKTNGLGSHDPWAICFPACEEMEKILSTLQALVLSPVIVGISVSSWKVKITEVTRFLVAYARFVQKQINLLRGQIYHHEKDAVYFS